MSDGFYRAFEDKYRGSRELILSRLKSYLPFTAPLKRLYPTGEIIDLGCGRGEWLELMQEEGFRPLGVDLDEGMLRDCSEQGLIVQHADAIQYLSKLTDNSQVVVSAFHVVEHISFDQLRTLVSEALRALKPGGLLIMETPNPENITVATKNFYLDPTHQKPIPSELLSFVSEYAGFERVKVIGLQESSELASNFSPTLNDVISGASPDYAVIAQKTAENEVLEQFDTVFFKNYGLELHTLAERYDVSIETKLESAIRKVGLVAVKVEQAEVRVEQAEAKVEQAEAKVEQAKVRSEQAEAKVEQAEAKVEQAEVRAEQAEAKVEQAEVRAEQAEVRAEQAEAKVEQAEVRVEQAEAKVEQAEVRAEQAENKVEQAEVRAEQAENKTDQAFTHIQAVYASRFWRITAPLRWVGHQAKFIRERGLKSRINDLIKKILRNAMMFAKTRPKLKQFGISLANKFGLYERLRRLYNSSAHPVEPYFHARVVEQPEGIAHLTLHAQRIYASLKVAIENNKEQK